MSTGKIKLNYTFCRFHLLRYFSHDVKKRLGADELPRSFSKIVKRKGAILNESHKKIKLKKATLNESIIENSKNNTVETIMENNDSKTNQSNAAIECERVNEMNVQMLSKAIYEQIFKNSDDNVILPNLDNIRKCRRDIELHKLNIDNSPRLPEVNFQLPKLDGCDILEHFYNISEAQSKPYRDLIQSIVKNDLPPMPEKWIYKAGWHQYKQNGDIVSVPFPPEEALVFDVEVCMKAGTNPTLACAVSPTTWYGWVSQELIDGKLETGEPIKYELNDLVPLESLPETKGYNLTGDILKPKIVIGHNVSYDRARIKEQYWIERTGARFFDTMSMHICVSGITSYQRTILKTKNKPIEVEDESWIQISSLNSLSEVYKLYCGKELSKATRDIFVEGTLDDVRNNFQEVMTYCAGDSLATATVLKCLYPMFQERFPHPATLAGMLELGSAYLPVNSNWIEYMNSSDLTYEDVELESKLLLERKANEACKLMHGDKYKEDMWMWDQDWSTQHIKMKKTISKVNAKKKESINTENNLEEKTNCNKNNELGYFDYQGNFIYSKQENFDKKDNCFSDFEIDESNLSDPLEEKFAPLFKNKEFLFAVKPLLPGYPAWYRKLCTKPGKSDDWVPGPNNISTSMQITPKLLSLTWEGYPLHYIKGEGWGFLIPFKYERSDMDDDSSGVPFESLVKNCPVVECENTTANKSQSQAVLGQLWKEVEGDIGKRDYYSRVKKDKTNGIYKGTGIWTGIVLSDCCYFMRLPHKDGTSKRVGNPLARDFLNKFSENVLSGSGEEAKKVLTAARMLSYWRNNRDRIREQKVIWLSDKELPPKIKHSNITTKYGAILPQVVVCGTLTRRATEPTWMTASNAHKERIGSELRALIQCPPGYNFVGADVDSQELWIASILGDSQFGVHGATPFGWMTLSGSKASGTDMHSHTAAAANITRDHAKVINYARIYGAGQNFAERLLKQFNPSISDGEAKSKAIKMFTTTKGKRICRLKDEYIELVFVDYVPKKEELFMPIYQANKIVKTFGKSMEEMFDKPEWRGGTESAMFNELERIAGSEEPKTPFLNCQLTRALMADEDLRKRHLPTAVNWVVQSGAVDFLHLMLVNMAWLTGSKARFCLSFHDEVRYLVPQEYKYNVALAMHITNLFTRAYCAKKLGFNDLPQSVAFFTSVDVDTVLRKEANLDCETPSNPHGLSKGYGIPLGESLDIWKTLEKCRGSLGELFTDDLKGNKKDENPCSG